MRKRSCVVLAALTLLGAVLRVASPARVGLWRDEVQALNIAALPDLGAINQFLYHHESHPPLYYCLAHGLGVLTGSMQASVAILVLLASMGLVPAVWWLARLTGISGAAPVASALVAISLPITFFGVELRPYSLVALLVVSSSGSLLNGLRNDATRWRALWAALALCLLYLHHVGLFVVLAQAGVLVLVSIWERACRTRLASWWPWVCLVLALSIPDLVLVLQQSVATGVPAYRPITPWGPLAKLAAVSISFPGELVVGLVGALLALYHQGPLRRIAALFLLTMAFLTLASYQAQFLQAYILVAVAPLGMTCAGAVLAVLARRGSRWTLAVLAEATVVCVAFSAKVMVGATKSNTEAIAHIVRAEALDSDLILLVPGAYGPSFNHYFRGSQSQINFPVMGRIDRYEFDHDFERMASIAALNAATDSMLAACRAGRRLWMVVPANWLTPGTRPVILDWRTFGGLGQADAARANLLDHRADQLFGSPVHRLSPKAGSRGIEMLQALLYDRANGASRGPDASCVSDWRDGG